MDQHPIPQDVTGFQFKLIGTMTVKQFGYVASGVIMAVVLYYMPLAGFFGILVKVLLIPLFGGSGAFIAFVPIEGRPVDVMATNFFKAIFSPNQYIYHKQGRRFSFSMINTTALTPAETQAHKQSTTATVKQKEVSNKEAQLRAYLQSSHNETQTSLDQKETAMISALALPTAPAHVETTPAAHTLAPKPHPIAAPAPKPVLKPLAPIVEQKHIMQQPAPAASSKQQQEQTLAQQENSLQQQLQNAKQEETTTHAPGAHEKVTTLEKELQEIHAQKQQLEQELLKLKTQLSNQAPLPAQPAQTVQPVAPVTAPVQKPVLTPQPAPIAAAPVMTQSAPATTSAGIPASQYAKTVAPTANKKADLPNISDTPNVVVGIVKDPRGNILPNMLVEVKDKDGNPVRAFKTNALGQFASATPLAKGIYTIELDDPKKQHSFDVIQITANNQIMLPIEIISHDAREELRKQLFN
jgi:hypothetical protein